MQRSHSHRAKIGLGQRHALPGKLECAISPGTHRSKDGVIQSNQSLTSTGILGSSYQVGRILHQVGQLLFPNVRRICPFRNGITSRLRPIIAAHDCVIQLTQDRLKNVLPKHLLHANMNANLVQNQPASVRLADIGCHHIHSAVRRRCSLDIARMWPARNISRSRNNLDLTAIKQRLGRLTKRQTQRLSQAIRVVSSALDLTGLTRVTVGDFGNVVGVNDKVKRGVG